MAQSDQLVDQGLEELARHIAGGLGEAVGTTRIAEGELTVSVEAGDVPRVLKFLRDDAACGFSVLIDLCGVDWPERAERFDVVYHLLSPGQNQRVRLKTTTDEKTPVPSITELYPAADWFEREAFDLYGIVFSGHPDLRRILTDYGFDGYPLRKDFPLTGHVEVRYDDTEKRVIYEPVKLMQEFRTFDFESPWEGPDYPLPGDEKASQDREDKGEG